MPKADQRASMNGAAAADSGANGADGAAVNGAAKVDNSQPWQVRGSAGVFAMPHLTAGERLVAIDCEMCLTAEGPELTRVSAVDAAGQARAAHPASPHRTHNRSLDQKSEQFLL